MFKFLDALRSWLTVLDFDGADDGIRVEIHARTLDDANRLKAAFLSEFNQVSTLGGKKTTWRIRGLEVEIYGKVERDERVL